jgi:putative membrane protein
VSLSLIFTAVWCRAATRPVHPEDWLLENYLVFISVPLTVVLGLYFRLSNLSSDSPNSDHCQYRENVTQLE